ncbi:MAG: Fic family protein [Pseudomonadota bacterium]
MQQDRLDEELESILSVIKQSPDGIKIGQIASMLSGRFSKRTLFRRLATLKELNLVESQGARNSTRYFIKAGLLLLSDAGRKLQADVQRPLFQRAPKSYNRDFLYGYQPNKTFYLPKNARQHLKQIGRPFDYQGTAKTYVKRILHRLLIDLSWNSSRLEGNTYSLLETRRLLEYGAVAKGKQAFETQMILNHKDALSFIVGSLDELGLNSYTVLNVHALLANNLLKDPMARGRLRQIPVGIAKSTYYPPEIPQSIEIYFEHLLHLADEIHDPFEQAFFVLVQLPYLQPFEDVNKRVSRLIANLTLLKNNLSPLSFIGVSQNDYIDGLLAIYELNGVELLRDIFIWAYERSAQQYEVVQDTLQEPNLMQARFRKELLEIVQFIVSRGIRGAAIIQAIQEWAERHIEARDRENFIEIAEREIASLHPGNIAVYRIKPEVFEGWKIL